MEKMEKESHKIESSYITSQMIGSFFASVLVGVALYAGGWFITFIILDDGKTPPVFLWPLIWGLIIGFAIILLTLTFIFDGMYYRNFSYEISEKFRNKIVQFDLNDNDRKEWELQISSRKKSIKTIKEVKILLEIEKHKKLIESNR